MKIFASSFAGVVAVTTLFATVNKSNGFSTSINTNSRSNSLEPLQMGYGVSNRDRSKRQERVGQVVRTEIASIIQLGYQVKNARGTIDDELRRRINIVNADVSPDLRQARITVSVIKPSKRFVEEDFEDEFDEESGEEEFDEESEEEESEEEEFDEEEEEEYDEEEEEFDDLPKQVFPNSSRGDAVVDRRRAYSWLVKNTKQIRHALSQRLSHMKTIPNLTFVQADVGAAVDVMNLIEKVSQGDYKRENLGMYGAEDDKLPEGMYLESELEGDGWIDDEIDDFDWVDEDEKEEDSSNKKK